MNALSPTVAEPVGAASPAGPVSEEALRQRLFDQFNAFWVNAMKEGVPYDTIGTMAITAAVYGLQAKHGQSTTAQFLEGILASVRSGEFAIAEHGRPMGA